jgi:hypothetical protein
MPNALTHHGASARFAPCERLNERTEIVKSLRNMAPYLIVPRRFSSTMPRDRNAHGVVELSSFRVTQPQTFTYLSLKDALNHEKECLNTYLGSGVPRAPRRKRRVGGIVLYERSLQQDRGVNESWVYTVERLRNRQRPNDPLGKLRLSTETPSEQRSDSSVKKRDTANVITKYRGRCGSPE